MRMDFDFRKQTLATIQPLSFFVGDRSGVSGSLREILFGVASVEGMTGHIALSQSSGSDTIPILTPKYSYSHTTQCYWWRMTDSSSGTH